MVLIPVVDIQNLVMILFSAIIAAALLIFLCVLGAVIICDKIILIKRLNRQGIRKELRKEIFRKLKVRRNIIRQRKKEERKRNKRSRRGLG